MSITSQRVIWQRLALTAATLLLLAGCQFAPLKSDAPKSNATPPTEAKTETPTNPCVANCDIAQTQCEARQQLREQLCQDEAARLQNDTKPCNTTITPLCPKPTACLGVDMRLCRAQHKECVARCAAVPPPAPKDAAPDTPATEPAQP